jgi:membrane protein
LNELLRSWRERLWQEHDLLSRGQRHLVTAARYAVVIARDLMDGQLSMRAMSLIYTTLLSIVPVLALAFSVLKALGVHNMLEPLLLRLLQPLGPQSVEITQNVIGFVDNIKVGVLGSIGVFFLLFTVISLVQKVEQSFNFIWRIQLARGLSQRFGQYLSVLMVGPLLVALAIGATAAVMKSTFVAQLVLIEPFGFLTYVATRLVPYVLIVAAFTFLYAFVPNTRVRTNAALIGGLLAGVLWQSASVLFAKFVAQATSYNAVYSSFAIFLVLLIWLYVSWLILLVGCQLSFYVQHPEHLGPTKVAPYLSARGAEFLGLSIVALVGQRFLKAEPVLDRETIARQLGAAPDHVEHVIEVLIHQRVLAVAGEERMSLLPGRDLDSLTVAQLWQLIRRGFDDHSHRRSPVATSVANLLERAEGAFDKGAGHHTVRAWLEEKGAGDKPGSSAEKPGS